VFQYDEYNPTQERQLDLIRIWYPNEATPFIDEENRTVDVQAVYGAGGLIGRWRLDRGFGTDAPDASGKGNGGTLENGATWTEGPLESNNSAVAFVANDDEFIRIPHDTVFDVAEELTVSAWVKGQAQAGKHTFAHWDTNGNQRSWYLGTGGTSTDKLRVGVSKDGNDSSTSAKNYESSLVAFDGDWHHIAFTFNNGSLRLFVDGIEDLDPNKINDAAMTSVATSTADLTIGSSLNNNNPTSEFTGSVSDVRLYNRALTPDEVARVSRHDDARCTVRYEQDDTSADYGRVMSETVGNPNEGSGGSYNFAYSDTNLPDNDIDSGDPIVFQCTVTDRNGNETEYGFNAARMQVRVAVNRNRSKINIPSFTDFPKDPGYVTWTKYNERNQPEEIIYPEGNSVTYEYSTGNGIFQSQTEPYSPRVGLLEKETHKPGNSTGG